MILIWEMGGGSTTPIELRLVYTLPTSDLILTLMKLWHASLALWTRKVKLRDSKTLSEWQG